MAHRVSLVLVLTLPACFNPGHVADSDPGLGTTTETPTSTSTGEPGDTTTVSAGESTAEPGTTTDEPDPTTGVVDTGSTGTLDACEPDPCDHGTCTPEGDGFGCACELGWAGELCDGCDVGFVPSGTECIAVASCDQNPCGMGAACMEQDVGVLCTRVFTLTGADQPWLVPEDVTSVDMTARAASGGCALAGWGGEAIATVPVMPGDTLHVFVGGAGPCSVAATLPGGYNGGGNKFTDAGDSWEGGSGGGATDVRRNGTALGDRVIVAGGGGGQGWGGQAGHGGGIQGETCNGVGGGCNDETCGGRGGTQVAGGIGGFCYDGCVGQPGVLGQGGTSAGCAAAGGGGGGGYYGGGGGGHCSGGGGSSRVDFPGNSGTSTTVGVNVGDGVLTLEWRR